MTYLLIFTMTNYTSHILSLHNYLLDDDVILCLASTRLTFYHHRNVSLRLFLHDTGFGKIE